jgi:acetolactate synthase I/II/III large subunit
VIQIGIDPFYQNYPIRSFPCDLAIQSDSSVAIPLLAEALSDHIKKIQDRITKRYQHVHTLHKEQRNAWRQALEKVRHSSPLDPLWVSHCINRVKDENTIIFNEYDLQTSGRMIKKCPAMAANLSHRFRLKSLCESYEEETIKDFSFRHK